MKTIKKVSAQLLIGLALTALGGAAVAGPVIIDGTDSNDHGSVSLGVNQQGWKYMQQVLENLALNLTAAASKTVVSIGTSGGQAGAAITSAFNLSTLPGQGWLLNMVDGATNIATYLGDLSTANTGVLYIPTYNNSSGDLAFDEMQAINANAASIDTFVSGAGNPTSGGALFAQGETGTGAYGWLATLIPGILFVDQGAGGIGNPLSLTAAGNTAFPGLTNADLSSGPWHGNFAGNLGGLSVLATSTVGGVSANVIIGGGAGTVISCGGLNQPPCPPTSVPEPGILALLSLGIFGFVASRRRRR